MRKLCTHTAMVGSDAAIGDAVGDTVDMEMEDKNSMPIHEGEVGTTQQQWSQYHQGTHMRISMRMSHHDPHPLISMHDIRSSSQRNCTIMIHSYPTHNVPILYPYCTHTGPQHHSYPTHTPLILHSYPAHTPLIPHSYPTVECLDPLLKEQS